MIKYLKFQLVSIKSVLSMVSIHFQWHEARIISNLFKHTESPQSLGFPQLAMLQHLQTHKKSHWLSSKSPWIPQVASCLSSVFFTDGGTRRHIPGLLAVAMSNCLLNDPHLGPREVTERVDTMCLVGWLVGWLVGRFAVYRVEHVFFFGAKGGDEIWNKTSSYSTIWSNYIEATLKNWTKQLTMTCFHVLGW